MSVCSRCKCDSNRHRQMEGFTRTEQARVKYWKGIIKELKGILRDCITTKVDAETWRYEMHATIDDVIGEFDEEPKVR